MEMPELGTERRDVFNDDHHQFRETVRRFFRKEVEPHFREWEKQGIFPADVFRKAGAAGILQAGVPAEYGGGGGDFLPQVLLREGKGYSLAGASLGGGLAIDCSRLLLLAGGNRQRIRLRLPK